MWQAAAVQPTELPDLYAMSHILTVYIGIRKSRFYWTLFYWMYCSFGCACEEIDTSLFSTFLVLHDAECRMCSHRARAYDVFYAFGLPMKSSVHVEHIVSGPFYKMGILTCLCPGPSYEARFIDMLLSCQKFIYTPVWTPSNLNSCNKNEMKLSLTISISIEFAVDSQKRTINEIDLTMVTKRSSNLARPGVSRNWNIAWHQAVLIELCLSLKCCPSKLALVKYLWVSLDSDRCYIFETRKNRAPVKLSIPKKSQQKPSRKGW